MKTTQLILAGTVIGPTRRGISEFLFFYQRVYRLD